MVYVHHPLFLSERFHNSGINQALNPFKQQDDQSGDTTYAMPKWGYIPYRPEKYPNAIEFPKLSSRYTWEHNEHDDYGDMTTGEYAAGYIGMGGQIKYPRGCIREMRKFKSCVAEKGAESSCQTEKDDIVAICPNWVLDSMREKKKWTQRAEAIDNEVYRRAMEVSDYNKGRTVSDLTIKNWSYGTRKNLRPETLWADDRYDPKYWYVKPEKKSE